MLTRLGSVDEQNIAWVCQSLFSRVLRSHPPLKGTFVLDLGAHIGAFTLLAATTSECRVLAIEPEPISGRLLQINTLLNGLETKVDILHAAVGPSTGETTLHKASETWGHTTVVSGGPDNVLTGEKLTVPAISLKDIFESHSSGQQCGLLKFNIEGAEFEVFASSDTNVLSRIQTIVGELHFDLGSEEKGLGLVSRLRSAGFHVEVTDESRFRSFLVATRSSKTQRLRNRFASLFY